MDTGSFLRHILPSTGLYVLAWYPASAPGRFRHSVHDTIDAATKKALALDAAGHTVYHACSSYAERKVWDEKKEKWRVRVVRNAAAIRAQWVDVDVGKADGYPTRKAALKAVKALCDGLQIPRPTIISSGAGFHLYWVFDRDIPAADALPLMVQFRDAVAAQGFKQDRSRTADLASILRPVGTHHRKGEPRPVTLVMQAQAVAPEALYGTLPALAAPIVTQDDEDWGSGQDKSYPPADTKKVVADCRAMRLFIKRKAVVAEPAWRAVIGVLKHTTKGEAAVHKLSALDPRYSRAETQEKIDGYTAPPITCKTIEGTELGKACEKCPFHGKIKTPVSLGQTADSPPPKQVVAKQAQAAIVLHPAQLRNNSAPETLPFWPRGYQWDGTTLHRFVPASESKSNEAMWRPFSNTLYYPYLRFETADNTRAVRICALIDTHNNRWRDFDVDATKVAEPQALAYALGAHEVLFMPSAKADNRQYVQDVLFGLRNSGIDTATYSSFGWHGDGFVIGNERITARGEEPVFLSGAVPQAVNSNFGRKGTWQEWARIVNEVYDRPKAEPFQFALVHALAAPLVRLCETDNYHGLSAGYTGESGIAKTVTAMVACSVFGDPRKFIIQANEEGTTIRALIQRISVMRDLPLILDEITGREIHEVQSMLFSLANGRPKLRLRSDGSEINTNQSWATNTFVTGNLSITRLLSGNDRAKAGATQVRCFEIALDAEYLQDVFPDINAKQLIEHDLLSKNYGEAGRRFLRFVAKNREKVTELLHKERTKRAPKSQEETRERFYHDMIACAMVAGKIAKKLGLIDFNMAALEKWAYEHILTLRSQRVESMDTAEDLLQAMLSWLQQHTITTKFYKDGRNRMDDNIVPSMREAYARIAVEDKRIIVTHKAFKDWCGQHKINPTWLGESLVHKGFMRPGVRRERIFKGTSAPGAYVNCVEFIYTALDNRHLILPEYMASIEAAEKARPAGRE